MKKQSKKKPTALSAWLDALTKIAADLAPVPTLAEGCFLEPDFRRLSVALPPQSLIDAALAEVDGERRDELTRRAERAERNYTNFVAARRKWREEIANPIAAMRGELGELAAPGGKLQTFRRNVCGDVSYLTGLLKPKRTSPLYPTDESAIEILAEGVKRHARQKYKGYSWRKIALSLLETEQANGTRPYWARMMGADCPVLSSKDTRVQKAAANWGKYLSYYFQK